MPNGFSICARNPGKITVQAIPGTTRPMKRPSTQQQPVRQTMAVSGEASGGKFRKMSNTLLPGNNERDNRNLIYFQTPVN